MAFGGTPGGQDHPLSHDPDARYLNCDLPSVQRSLADSELFLDGLAPNAVVVFDEVHRLPDPSQLLKIAADEYAGFRVLATGSSTLAATGKFRDSLAGRKFEVHLPPVPWDECIDAFGIADLDRRLLHGPRIGASCGSIWCSTRCSYATGLAQYPSLRLA